MKKKRKTFFNQEAVDRVVNFFATYITHVEGSMAGKPYILDDWIINDIVKPVFGPCYEDTGFRVVREVYIEIPKKNSKTTLCAGLGLYFETADRENFPRVLCAAASRDQAKILFDTSKGMVLNNKELAKLLKPMHNSIVKKDSKGAFQIIAADADFQHGHNASAVIIDELHAHKNRDLYDTLKGAGLARDQSMLISITTAGYDFESICYNRHDYTEKINTGMVKDPSFFGIIYAAGVDDDPFVESTWIKANPNYGKSVKKEVLKSLATEAKNDLSYLNVFKRLHLNIWTRSHTQWIDNETYNECNLGGNISDLKGLPAWIGIDLGSTDDITCVSVVVEKEGIFNVIPYFFCTENKIDAVQNNTKHVMYYRWHEQNFLTVTPGETTDYEYVKDTLKVIIETYKVKAIGYDGWNASQLANDIKREFYGIPINVIPMTVKYMNAPAKELEMAIRDRRLNHYGNPVLRWMFDNVMIKRDGNGNIFLNKKESTGKIDGVVATAMAVAEWMNDENKHFGNQDFEVSFL